MLLYLDIIPASIRELFRTKLLSIAEVLGMHPNWLMQVMKSESSLNPRALNPYSSAAGLLQWMPSTLRAYNVTTSQILAMGHLQQLDYVLKYFLPKKGKINSYYDTYAYVFFPAIIGKADDWILHTSTLPASVIASQNPVININKDGKITVAEFKAYVFRSVGSAAAYVFVSATEFFKKKIQ